jgi:endonuclease/exonuclease/phosphatase family metal-dependent hydrolase
MRRIALLLAVIVAASACRTSRNYPSPEGPRYAGPAPAALPPTAGSDTVRVVSFNVEFALQVDSAIAVLTGEPELRGADVVLLQEMDEPGTKRIADALGMGYVFYPASFSLRTERDFGNAVLSRWPIVGDEKLVLPHLGLLVRTQRTATAATVRIRGRDVRVYSAHLGTLVNLSPRARRDQMRAVLADAARHPPAIVGGDLNQHSVGSLAVRRGFAWPTKDGPRTTRFGRWDHIFFKGLAVPDSAAAGTVLDVRGTSDHRAVWARAVLP